MTFRSENAAAIIPLSSVSLHVICRICRLASQAQARRRLLHIGFTPGGGHSHSAKPNRRSYCIFRRGAVVALRKNKLTRYW